MKRILVSPFRGFLLGAGVGVMLAGADILRILVLVDPLGPRIRYTVFWYSLAWGVGGALIHLLASLLGKGPYRYALPVLFLGSFLFLAVQVVNTSLPPPVSLGIDLLLLAGSVWLLRRWARSSFRLVRVLTAICLLAVLAPLAHVFSSLANVHHPDRPELRVDQGPRPSVLLVVVDALRADHTSLHGYHRETTPRLDRFAKEARVYLNARSSSSWTRPSVATILTGLPPGIHGAQQSLDVLPEEAVTLGEIFKEAGYRTGFFSDNPVSSGFFGYAQGFDHVDDNLPRDGLRRFTIEARGEESLGIHRDGLLAIVLRGILGNRSPFFSHFETLPERKAEEMNRRFLEWQKDLPGGEPWFAYLHYMDPHSPYWTPEPFGRYYGREGPEIRGIMDGKRNWGWGPFEASPERSPERARATVDAYDTEVRYWDHSFGLLLDELERREALDDLIVLVTSDHGEEFYEHGLWSHARSLYEPVLRVPFVLRIPGGAAGEAVRAVTLEGVAPTLLEAVGLELCRLPLGFSRSILAERDQQIDLWLDREEVDLSLRGRIEGNRKWIFSRMGDRTLVEVYDLDEDPGEERNLSGTETAATEEVRTELRRLDEIHSKVGLIRRSPEAGDGIDRMLRGLGYLD